MTNTRKLLIALGAAIAFPMVTGLAKAAEPKIKVLASPQDPTKEAVLIGRTISAGLTFQLELEGAEAMWMPMGTPAQWREHAPARNERYHIEFKVTDNATKTRLPYATITFAATNQENGKTVETTLAPMWGSSGLHYSENSALAGDGVYAATVTVGVPTFAREMKDKDLWSKPASARFHFRLKDGMLVEVSEPVPAAN
ncbi:iron transporter [Pseudomonas sp. MAP12]|uniref:Iron transporter n=1 Tax=Geopseudomonas aromaticivorans TaxID=2849492 RepID=A0ABS6MS45_9GAMM|nr:iron transporter [Pseudomonas aromaticivorans]MBV2131622.1 iron transporter [Pseudomonas aromaticivorans]